MTPSPKLEHLPGEDNWDYCLRVAAAMDKDSLIRDLLVQIEKMRTPKSNPPPLWSYVAEATCHGCGYSSAIVYVYYPDQRGK
jgi:hypothetical protein